MSRNSSNIPIHALFTVLITVLSISVRYPQGLEALGMGGTSKSDEKSTAPQPPTILPSPDEKLSPIETESLDEAGKAISKKVEQIEKKASGQLGEWVFVEVYAGITWIKFLVALICLLVVIAVERVLHTLIKLRIQRIQVNGQVLPYERMVLEALSKPLSLFVLAYGSYAALSTLLVHLKTPYGDSFVVTVAARTTEIIGTVAVIWFVFRLVRVVELPLKKWADTTDSRIDDILVRLIGKGLRVFVVFIGAYMLIQNLTGVEFYPVIASLGLGGLAVALAAKESVADFFGTLTIMFDKPFLVGDRIVLENHSGFVEYVGFRSTRIRTVEGHVVTIPNDSVVNSPVENISSRPFLRWHTEIFLSYDTPKSKVIRAVEIIREILDNHEGMDEDYPPRVYFNGFGKWSLGITLYAWYHPPLYWDYQAWVQQTCLEIMDRFEHEGIRLALPSDMFNQLRHEGNPGPQNRLS